MPDFDALPAQLDALEAKHRRRQRVILQSPQSVEARIDGRDYLCFASNDYLGLANDPRLKAALIQGVEQWGCGSGASALVTGHSAAHEALERACATFVQREKALLFGDGFLANLGVIPALCDRSDTIFADRLNHASLNDACQLSRADFRRFHHNDLKQLRAQLKACNSHTKLIAVDAVYSMDGDEAPLADLLDIAEQNRAWLYVDDAHGFGVLNQGHGSAIGLDSPRLIYMATLGKAAGVAGAFVAGHHHLIDWLVTRAHTAIYTTAAPPALAVALQTALNCIEQDTIRRKTLNQHIAQLHAGCADLPWSLIPSRTPIQALIIGDDAQTLAIARTLREQGLWVPAIRPPTVPDGTARLRISLSASHSSEHIARLISALHQAAQAV